jgi:uncharacterized oxidoreductase
MDTEHSTVLITGATNENGIGIALARRLADRGSTVIVSGRNRGRLYGIAAEHPDLDTIHLDVDDRQSIATAVTSLARTHPELDAVMTMAGIMVPEDLHDPESVAVAEEIVASNLIGTIRTVRAFLPGLEQRPAATIVMVSSGLGFVPRADVPSYSASKAGVRAYADAIRLQLQDSNVQVALLVPPAVRTSLMHQEHMEAAVPVDQFADEVMAILINDPQVTDIVVEQVRPLYESEANGNRDELMRALIKDAG